MSKSRYIIYKFDGEVIHINGKSDEVFDEKRIDKCLECADYSDEYGVYDTLEAAKAALNNADADIDRQGPYHGFTYTMTAFELIREDWNEDEEEWEYVEDVDYKYPEPKSFE